MKRAPLGALVAVPALCSCFGPGAAAPQRYYVPAIPPLAGSPDRILGHTLAVSGFTVAPHLGSDRIAARTAPSEVEYYSNHRWACSLDRLVTEEVRRHLRSYWNGVLSEEAEADYVLSGRVELFEEEDAPEGWYGVAALSLTLRSRETDKPVWAGTLQSRRRALARNPGEVAAALGLALEEILRAALLDWWKIL